MQRVYTKVISYKAAPLYEILEVESKRSVKALVFKGEELEPFIQLKKELSNQTMGYQPNMEKEFIFTAMCLRLR